MSNLFLTMLATVVVTLWTLIFRGERGMVACYLNHGQSSNAGACVGILLLGASSGRVLSAEEHARADAVFLAMKPLQWGNSDKVERNRFDLREDEYLLQQVYQVPMVLEWPPDYEYGSGKTSPAQEEQNRPFIIEKGMTLESALASLVRKYPAMTWQVDREVVNLFPSKLAGKDDYPPNKAVSLPTEGVLPTKEIVKLLSKPLELAPEVVTYWGVLRLSLGAEDVDSQWLCWLGIAHARNVRLPVGKASARQVLNELVRGIPGGSLVYMKSKDGRAIISLGVAPPYKAPIPAVEPEPIPTFRTILAKAASKEPDEESKNLFVEPAARQEIFAKLKDVVPDPIGFLKWSCTISGFVLRKKPAAEKPDAVPFEAEFMKDDSKGLPQHWQLKSCKVGAQ